MRRIALVLAVLPLLLVSVTGCTTSCSDEEPDPALRSSVVEGEVTEVEVLVDEWSTNIALVTMTTDDGVESFELSGKFELIEVGERYRAEVFVDPENPNQTETGTAYLSGPDGCTDADNTIELLGEDGTTTPIPIPSAIPESPISLRQFLVGFGAFALVLFLFRYR